jgi:glucose-6-phosphate isomerase
MTVKAVGLYLDYSKNRVTDETLKLLMQLAEESRLRGRIDAMFRGDKINIRENRTVMHVALRANRQVKNSCDLDRSRNYPCRRTFSIPGAEGGGASSRVVFTGTYLTT